MNRRTYLWILLIAMIGVSSCENLNKIITPDSKSTDTSNSSNDNDDDNDNDSPEESNDGVGTWLFNNPDWDNPDLYEFRFNQLTGNGSDSISDVVNYNGKPCWTGISAQAFKGTTVWCRINDIDTDIFDVENAFSPRYLLVGGNNLYFQAFVGAEGYKMFKFDGTSVTQISNTNPGGYDVYAPYTQMAVATSTKLYFIADSGSEVMRVYQYDGTSTTVLPETDSDADDDPQYLTIIENDLYYAAYNEAHERRLYKWDGVTNLEVDPTKYTNLQLSQPFYIASIGNDHYFSLKKLDGFVLSMKVFKLTGTTLTEVPSINVTPALTSVPNMGAIRKMGSSMGSAIVFAAGSNKLYQWDGSALSQISNTNPGGNDSVSNLTLINSKIYFRSKLGNTQYHKLYEYDGSTVSQISDTNPGGNDDVTQITDHDGDVYFTAKDSEGSYKIYKYDGSVVSQVTDLNQGGSDNPLYLTSIENDLYFAALNEDENQRLHKVNSGIVTEVSELQNFGSDTIVGPVIHDDALYFHALDRVGGYALFKWDGSDVSMFEGAPTIVAPSTSLFIPPNSFASAGQNLYFIGSSDEANGYTKLFQWDGTEYTQISDIVPGGSDSINEFVAVGNDVYFSAYDGIAGNKVFRWDGSNVTQASNISDGGDDYPHNLIAFDGALYFSAYNELGQIHMYKSVNGVTTQAFDSNPGDTDDPDMFGMVLPAVIGSNMYFCAKNEFGQLKLFQWSGTDLTQISDINLGGDDLAFSITGIGANVYFTTLDGFLYQWDGSSVIQISTVSDGSFPLAVLGNDLYFSNYNNEGYMKLFRWDGTDVTQISNNRPDGDDYPSNSTTVGSKLFFTSNDENGLTKLYQYDGTEVSLVMNSNPGQVEYMSGYTAFNNDLYFIGQPRGFNRLMKIDF